MPVLNILLERIDPAQNMARYYVLCVEPTLFGDVSLVREWGRVGVSCCRRLERHECGADAAVALEEWLRRKQRRGYAILDSSIGNAPESELSPIP